MSTLVSRCINLLTAVSGVAFLTFATTNTAFAQAAGGAPVQRAPIQQSVVQQPVPNNVAQYAPVVGRQEWGQDNYLYTWKGRNWSTDGTFRAFPFAPNTEIFDVYSPKRQALYRLDTRNPTWAYATFANNVRLALPKSNPSIEAAYGQLDGRWVPIQQWVKELTIRLNQPQPAQTANTAIHDNPPCIRGLSTKLIRADYASNTMVCMTDAEKERAVAQQIMSNSNLTTFLNLPSTHITVPIGTVINLSH